jgi:type II secretory pathway component PulF
VEIIVAMRSYIVSCKTPDGNLQSRYVEARNHLVAVKRVESEGFTVLSVERDSDEARHRSRKRRKRLVVSIIVYLIIAAVCVAVTWLRGRFRI